MTETKQRRDWLAVVISVVSLLIAGSSAGYNIFFHQDDIRLVLENALSVSRDKQDFTLDHRQELTFINSGNRQAVISSVYGSLVLARGSTSNQTQCENYLSLAKSIVLDGSPIILKPGDIGIWHANVDIRYPWKKDGDSVRYHEDDAQEAAAKHIVCVEAYVITPDSSSFRWVQALYELPVECGQPVELFDKDQPLKVLQRIGLGLK